MGDFKICDDILPLDELKKLLELKDIDFDGDDETLMLLLKFKIDELAGLLGVDLLPVEREYVIQRFKSNKIFLNFYPVSSVSEITLNSNILDEDEFVVNKKIGVIYLNKIMKGMLCVDYTTKISDKEFENAIKPLVLDMVVYDLINKGNRINEGVMSSIHEGDVSISYDTGSSLGNRIYTRIGDLKLKYSMYTAKAKLL